MTGECQICSNTYFASFDEVGRGALFGPVAVGGVLFPAKIISEFLNIFWYNRVNDSKLLTEIQREVLVPKIEAFFITGVSYVSSCYIDRLNINLAVEKALYRLIQRFIKYLAKEHHSAKFKLAFIDGNYKFTSSYWNVDKIVMPRLKSILKGDQKSFTIACASILAKVYRDKLIKSVSINYPGYFLEKNKGYGTQKHRKAIQTIGISKHHRISFLKKILAI